jgi:hypothetical protein
VEGVTEPKGANKFEKLRQDGQLLDAQPKESWISTVTALLVSELTPPDPNLSNVTLHHSSSAHEKATERVTTSENIRRSLIQVNVHVWRFNILPLNQLLSMFLSNSLHLAEPVTEITIDK